MANIMIRNIPDPVLEMLKEFSEINKRSLNDELLIAIERGLAATEGRNLSSETQTTLWAGLAGKWKDRKPNGKQIPRSR
jgi:plasmid stability protein